jgi:hydroxymethylpyrimidine pyrophosphatase-like HAD family hydrolase
MLRCGPAGSSKWSGLQRYLEQANLTPDSVLSIGDGMNDYEMLLHSGYSVAMANAKDAVIEVADYVTEDNDSDGVAHILTMLFLDDELDEEWSEEE